MDQEERLAFAFADVVESTRGRLLSDGPRVARSVVVGVPVGRRGDPGASRVLDGQLPGCVALVVGVAYLEPQRRLLALVGGPGGVLRARWWRRGERTR